MEISLDRLTRRFGTKVAVDDFTATLTSGVHGLLGPNGAGKTTLIRMLAGLLAPNGGQMLLDGEDICQLGEQYRAKLGYLPQYFGYYPGFTAMDFLLYMAAVKGLPKPYAKAQAEELLTRVRLQNEAHRKIKTFSGGMRQRLGIAQAMLGQPDILLLDEPTAGLDPKERVFFRNMLSDYAKNKLVLLSTHIVADVESVADNVLVMKAGHLVHEGAPGHILRAIEGMVWECNLPLAEAEKLMQNHPVTSFRHEGEQVFLRLVAAQKPAEAAQNASPRLEDLYLYYFSDEEGGAPFDTSAAV